MLKATGSQGHRDQQALNSHRFARRGVHIDNRPGETQIFLRHLQGNVALRGKALQHLFDPEANDTVIGTGHANIRDQGRAPGEDSLIGGGHMGVGSEDRARFAVEEKAHRLFFARRLGMEVDNNDLNVVVELR